MQDDFEGIHSSLGPVRAYSYVRMSTRKQLRGDTRPPSWASGQASFRGS